MSRTHKDAHRRPGQQGRKRPQKPRDIGGRYDPTDPLETTPPRGSWAAYEAFLRRVSGKHRI